MFCRFNTAYINSIKHRTSNIEHQSRSIVEALQHVTNQFRDQSFGPQLEQLEDQITEMAGHINAVNYRFIKLFADFDEARGWQVDGVKSFAHWLNWKCGIGAMAARQKSAGCESLA